MYVQFHNWLCTCSSNHKTACKIPYPHSFNLVIKINSPLGVPIDIGYILSVIQIHTYSVHINLEGMKHNSLIEAACISGIEIKVDTTINDSCRDGLNHSTFYVLCSVYSIMFID